MATYLLGISAYYHDSAAALIRDGEIVAAAQEERFTRKKHDSSLPIHAIRYVLDTSGISIEDVCAVSFYDKPYLKFERLLETYHGFAPRGIKSFISAIPVWLKDKIFMKRMIRDELRKSGIGNVGELLFPEHHLSHAASAFYPSKFAEAAILTIDGVGEWATATIGHGNSAEISILRQLDFPHSLGLFYSAFTYFCGFKVNSGEYKLMGLAPYGNPDSSQTKEFTKIIRDKIIDIREDGSFLLNMENFNFATGLTMCPEKKWEQLFGIPQRKPESELTQTYMNMAFAVQNITDEIILQMAYTTKKLTKSRFLVMAGGVALNCVANGKLIKQKLFDDIWIQPAAGDAGGALGAAYAAWHIWMKKPRISITKPDAMQGAYLGPKFSDDRIKQTLKKFDAVFIRYSVFDELCEETANILDKGFVVGWFQDKMEFGPRALGNRSILGDPRKPEMQQKLNLKIKYREGFRPFAPSVLEEDISEYFELEKPSPYMLLVAPVKKERRKSIPVNYSQLKLYERLYQLRSDIPAITHVDFSARVQSVNRDTNQKYWKLIKSFKELTGFGIIVNTSFNVRGEPIVCTPEDAYKCFMRTEMDYLVIGNFLLKKIDQPEWFDEENWREQYELD